MNTEQEANKATTITGAHEFFWGGYRCHADVSGALFIDALELLIVSDLHLEKASHFARKQQYLPPYDTRKTLQRLEIVIGKFKPKTIVSLGDAFHDGYGRTRLSDQDTTLLSQLMEKHEFLWVVGNHDPEELQNTRLTAVVSWKKDIFCFVHEAEKKWTQSLGIEISGHYHPCATIIQRGRHLRRRCFVFDDSRMILPAFGSLTGSLNVTNPAIQHFFDLQRTDVFLLGQKSVHRVPFSICKRTV